VLLRAWGSGTPQAGKSTTIDHITIPITCFRQEIICHQRTFSLYMVPSNRCRRPSIHPRTSSAARSAARSLRDASFSSSASVGMWVTRPKSNVCLTGVTCSNPVAALSLACALPRSFSVVVVPSSSSDAEALSPLPPADSAVAAWPSADDGDETLARDAAAGLRDSRGAMHSRTSLRTCEIPSRDPHDPFQREHDVHASLFAWVKERD
jgi:hypothetical protein